MMKAKANLLRTSLVVLPVVLVAVAVALFGVGLRPAEPQTTTPKMQVQDLGTLGGVYSYATDINDSGKVVGFSFTSTGAQHAFLYDASAATPKMQDLGTLGGFDSRATGINNSGKVVGFSNTSTGEQHGFLYDGTNGMQDLNDVIPADSGGTIYDAAAINSDGQIAATVFKLFGTDPAVCQYENYSGGWSYAAVLRPATTANYEVQDLGTLGGDYSAAASINDSGTVVGYSLTSSCVEDAFLYDSTNGMQDLGTLGGPYSSATSINDSGKVVGYSADTYQSCTNNCWRAFLYDASAATPKMQDLGTLGGHSGAWGINDSGTVVGSSYVWGAGDHGFLKESGQPMIDLNTLIPADSGWTIRDATAINNYGQIAATGYKDGVGQRALLLTPTDIPPAADTEAPSPPTITSPQNNSYDTDGSFSVSGSAEAGSSVELFEGTTSKGTTKADSSSEAWSIDLSGLSEGPHTYTAKAKDAGGNTSSASNSVTVTVDTTEPMVNSSTTPLSGATGVGRGTNLTATFSEKMEPSTVNTTTFKLFKVNSDGTQTQITDVVVSLSLDGLKATLNPFGTKTTLLASRTKYKGVLTTGTKDLAGNPLAQLRSWTFTTKS